MNWWGGWPFVNLRRKAGIVVRRGHGCRLGVGRRVIKEEIARILLWVVQLLLLFVYFRAEVANPVARSTLVAVVAVVAVSALMAVVVLLLKLCDRGGAFVSTVGAAHIRILVLVACMSSQGSLPAWRLCLRQLILFLLMQKKLRRGAVVVDGRQR